MDVTTIASQQSAASTSAFSSLTKNIDTFLTLLTTQLRNQDPLEPLDTEKFTEQLVQFASVEQAIKTNSHLEALLALQAAGERDSALELLGRTATISSDKAVLANDAAQWTYTLPTSASTVSVSIRNENGLIVAQKSGATLAGVHEINWDGMKASGGRAPDGVYTLVVDARTPEGSPINAVIETKTLIKGVAFGDSGARLETAAGTFALGDVRRVVADNS